MPSVSSISAYARGNVISGVNIGHYRVSRVTRSAKNREAYPRPRQSGKSLSAVLSSTDHLARAHACNNVYAPLLSVRECLRHTRDVSIIAYMYRRAFFTTFIRYSSVSTVTNDRRDCMKRKQRFIPGIINVIHVSFSS